MKVSKFHLLLCASAMVSAAGSAQAADMMRRVPVAAPLSAAEVAYVQPTRVHDWTGFYAGGLVEYGWGDDLIGVLPPIAIGTANLRGFGGGVDVGYNYQSGNFVLGVEADVVVSSMKDDVASLVFGGSVATEKFPWLVTVRPRAGYAFDNFLIYATGGLAVGAVETSIATTAPAAGVSDKSVRAGFVVGGGVEYAFSRQISVKAEYLYTNLDTKQIAFGPGFSTQSIGVSQRVRVGVNYHF